MKVVIGKFTTTLTASSINSWWRTSCIPVMLASNQLVHPISYCLKKLFYTLLFSNPKHLLHAYCWPKTFCITQKNRRHQKGTSTNWYHHVYPPSVSIPTYNLSWCYLDPVFMSVSKISPLTCVLCPNLSQVTQGLCFSSSLLSLLINNFSSPFGLCTTTQTYC